MTARVLWTGVSALLLVALTDVLSNICTLFNKKTALAQGVAPEDVLGFGIAPVWLSVGILLVLILLLGRKHLNQNQLTLLTSVFLFVFTVDCIVYSKLLTSMGL